VIRFSAFLVVVAVGLLVARVVTSKLWLVYIAIGVSGVALLALGIGAAVNWRELTSKTAETSAQGPAAQAAALEAQPSQVPVPAGSASVGSGWPATAPRPGAQPPGSRPDDVPRAPAAFTPRREPPAASVWEFRDNTIQVPPAAEAPAPPRPTPPPPLSGPAAEPAPSRKPAQSAAPPTSPQPVVKPVPPRDEDIAEPSPTAERDQPPAKEQPEPAPEPELTLVPGATVAASAAASAPATSQAERPEQDKQAAEAEAEAEPAGPDPTMEVTVAPGVPRYHNAHCTLIRFMGDSDLDKMTLAAAREIGCTPCRACLPDQPEGSPE